MAMLILQRKANAYPFPLVMAIGKSFTQTTREILGWPLMGKAYGIYEKGLIMWATDEDDHIRRSNRLKKAVLENPGFISRLKDTFLERVSEFKRTVEHVAGHSPSKLSGKDVYTLLERFYEAYNHAYAWSEPVPFLTKDSIAEYLLEYMLSKTAPEKAHRYLNTLSSPLDISFIRREEMDMLNLASKVRRNPEAREMLLKEHTKKWRWIPYDYGVMTWTRKHFKKELDDTLEKKDPERELKKIKDYFSGLKKEQERIIKELDIDMKHQQLLEDVRDCAFIMDRKKEEFTKSHLAIRPLLKEAARRTGLSLAGVQFLMWDEAHEGLVERKKPDKRGIEGRKELCCLTFTEDKISMSEGKEAERIIGGIKKSVRQKSEGLKGVPASSGKHKGKARIILDAKHIGRLGRGEVLVTNMTSPDFTAGMKKAGAIVTNEGGITCHAAIVSRELNIPCVIGTGNASEVLKDGDEVEVDADEGVVRRIKK